MEVPTIVVPEVTEESIEERALNEIFSPTEMPAAEKARRAAMMKKKGRLAKMRKDQRSARNSTSSVYADSTIVRPNLSSLIRSIAKSLHACMLKGESIENRVIMDLFDEQAHPFTEDKIDFSKPPAEGYVFLFLQMMFQIESLPPECGIMMLAYIDRIIEKTNLTLHVSNYRRLALGCLILATKVWEEEEVWNADFQSIFPKIESKDLAQLEKKILNLLSFNVSLPASVYAKYYFELRSLAANEAFSIPPLDKDGAARIEVSSTAETERLRQATPVPAGASPARARAQSVDYSTMVPQAAPLILS